MQAVQKFLTPASLLKSGPTSQAYYFPDTQEGNKAMCRQLKWLGLHAEELPTWEQTARQGPVVADHFGLASDDDYVYGSLGIITERVLVVVGSQDAILGLNDSIVLVEKIPGASLLQFPDSGHSAMMQEEVAASSMIAAFLDAA